VTSSLFGPITLLSTLFLERRIFHKTL
jgi:hypothetical protein